MPTPYDEIALAKSAAVTKNSVHRGDARHAGEKGVIRRIGVVPNHYRLGLRSNGMTVWDIADDQIEHFLAKKWVNWTFVSHCYHRPSSTYRIGLITCLPWYTAAIATKSTEKVNRIADVLGRGLSAT